MKRIIITILFIMMFCPNIKAENCIYSCAEPYDLSAGASRFMSVVTGSNFLVKQIANIILKKEIFKNIDGKIKVKLDSYSVKDLKKGIFKNIKITGKNINIDGIEFKALELKSLCNFNYISIENIDNPVFKEDLVLGFKLELTEDNLNSTMQTANYKRIISDINNLGNGWGVFKIVSSEIKIRNNQLYYILNVAIPFVKSIQNIVFTSDLKVHRGKINFTNTKIVSESSAINLRKVDKIINVLNPLDFSFKILDNKNTELSIQNVYIKDDKIYADGVIIIPKDKE